MEGVRAQSCHSLVLGTNISVPQLIVEKIFGFLGRDVLKAVLVCKTWKRILNNCRYWKQIVLKINMENVSDVMNSDRLKLVGEIELMKLDQPELSGLFKQFAAGQSLRGRTLKCFGFYDEEYEYILENEENSGYDVHIGLRALNPQDIGIVATQLYSLDIDPHEKSYWLTADQVESIISMMAQSTNLPLKYLNLYRSDFSSCAPDSFAAAITRLNEIDLSSSKQTSDMLTKLCEYIISSKSYKPASIKFGKDASQVPSAIFSKALCRIKRVSLPMSLVSNELCNNILNSNVSELQDLELKEADFHQSPMSLSKVVCKISSFSLKTVRFSICDEYPAYVVNIFNEIASSGDLNLTHLELMGINLSSICKHVLAKAVCRILNVKISLSDVGADRISRLCEEIVSSPKTKLQTFSLDYVFLRDVPEDVLAKAFCRLQNVDLKQTGFSRSHYSILFREILNCDNLTLKTFCFDNLRYLVESDILVLGSAICKLVNVDLSSISLTGDQLGSIYESIANSGHLKLKELNVCGIFHDDVPFSLFMKAFFKLQVITFNKSDLLDDVFDRMLNAIIDAKEMNLKKMVIRIFSEAVDCDKFSLAQAREKIQINFEHRF